MSVLFRHIKKLPMVPISQITVIMSEAPVSSHHHSPTLVSSNQVLRSQIASIYSNISRNFTFAPPV